MANVTHSDVTPELVAQYAAHDRDDLLLRIARLQEHINRLTEREAAAERKATAAAIQRDSAESDLRRLEMAYMEINMASSEMSRVIAMNNAVLEEVDEFIEYWTTTDFPVGSRDRTVQLVVGGLVSDIVDAVGAGPDTDDYHGADHE